MRASYSSLVWIAFVVLGAAPTGTLRSVLAEEPFPGVETLPETKGLPDPFRLRDGKRVSTPREWREHRKRLRSLIEHYEYGSLPAASERVRASDTIERKLLGGLAIETRATLHCGPKGSLRFRVSVTRPSKGKGPFPVVFKNEDRLGPFCPILKRLVSEGFAFAEYIRADLDPDKKGVVGSAQAAYPENDWGTIAVWAWGGMRLVDYLSSLEYIDAKRIVCTGHSRGGKAALLTAALDERIALVVPNGSGAGGAGSFRVQGKRSESLTAITDPKRFGYWFHPRLRSFAGRENRLPFDQHFLTALVAPRGLLITEAREDLWANPLGTQHIFLATKEVYRFHSSETRVGIHVREGKHDQLVEDWNALFEFAQRLFASKRTERPFDRLPYPAARRAFEWKAPGR
ncbi:MAG: acetylxylan esterase [Planctomycetota bacterium]